MSDDRPTDSGYKISNRLLAQKGAAEPLSSTGVPLVLANIRNRAQTDDEYLTAAVMDATYDILTQPPRSSGPPKGPAPLTDLLDPALIDAARRGEDQPKE